MLYIGCFYVGIVSVNLIWGQQGSSGMVVWLVISLVGMIVSPWIVRAALNSVSQDTPVEPRPEVTDPFSD